MDEDLKTSLANNAKAWLALSLSISDAEKVAFDKIHDDFLSTYGPQFMVKVYRNMVDKVLRHSSNEEREKVMGAFKDAMDQAIDGHHGTH
ncbi:hypothetical protein [Hymenobacter jeollabukensis]|uniref:Uncharacterized protein n=1 Tax=Hymenobacter jeollabukensis TaxID=2025313 RepID=A0A5R8WKJ9_9BACT|nr:hypothetical protein [Hymenobacter jeollabukensis]TLM89463.1 hypothetical protein FDY95_20540 [Hymenobacter jeollabukensis]